MKKLLFSLFLLACTSSFAQKLIDLQKIDDNCYAMLKQDTSHHGREYIFTLGTGWDKDPPFARISVDSVYHSLAKDYPVLSKPGEKTDGKDTVDAPPASGNYWESIHIYNASVFFTSREKGFIFGTMNYYRCYLVNHVPFILRTDDGGKSWTLKYGKEIGPAQSGYVKLLEKETFYMFSEKRGFMLWKHSLHKGEISYSTTDDGGKTWKLQTLKVPDQAGEVLNIYFTHSGTVTLVLSLPREKNNQPLDKGTVVTMQSDDYGKTFRELK